MMDRRHWTVESGVNCALCQSGVRESREHLFFNCRFAQRCWRKINSQWDAGSDIMTLFRSARDGFSGPCFMEIVSSAQWNIWTQRNDLIFEKKPASLVGWHRRLVNDLNLIAYRVKSVDIEH